jgi:tetratricopeptide (TPR) repeat protein
VPIQRWLLAAFLAFPFAAPAEDIRADATIAQILALPPPLQEQFAQRVLAGEPSRRERLERMVDFVFDARGLGMGYEDGATRTVEEAYATRRANCLGFTLLFLAMAREAGLEAYPQVYEQTLSWQRAQGTFYRNSHVNAVVRIGPRKFTLDVARGAVITHGRPVRLDERGLLTRYHNNRAIELLGQGDLEAARRHMAIALRLDPERASHWSNAGVLELHSGDAQAARYDYARALQIDPENADALFNEVGLARRDGDRTREAAFRERLRQVQQKDPFHHFLQAVDYERAGDFARAIEYYRRAIKLHRLDHRFHAALANVLERAGDDMAARDAWQRAVYLSDGAVQATYQARLQALRSR